MKVLQLAVSCLWNVLTWVCSTSGTQRDEARPLRGRSRDQDPGYGELRLLFMTPLFSLPHAGRDWGASMFFAE